MSFLDRPGHVQLLPPSVLVDSVAMCPPWLHANLPLCAVGAAPGYANVVKADGSPKLKKRITTHSALFSIYARTTFHRLQGAPRRRALNSGGIQASQHALPRSVATAMGHVFHSFPTFFLGSFYTLSLMGSLSVVPKSITLILLAFSSFS